MADSDKTLDTANQLPAPTTNALSTESAPEGDSASNLPQPHPTPDSTPTDATSAEAPVTAAVSRLRAQHFPARGSTAPVRQMDTPASAEIADKTALVLIDVGTPASPDDVTPFLKRLYADHRVFDWPLGALGRGLISAISRRVDAGNLRRALELVGGHASEGDGLSLVGEFLCEQLNRAEGLPTFSPFVAFQYASPSIEDVIADIRGQDFTQIVAIWSRPLPSLMATAARKRLLRCSDIPGTPPIAFIENWLDEERLAPCVGELVRQGLAQFPEDKRSQAIICFALQALPIEGDRDPALAMARSLGLAALNSAQICNRSQVFYLDALAPRARLAPSFEDLCDRLIDELNTMPDLPRSARLARQFQRTFTSRAYNAANAPKNPPLLVVPLHHLVEGLSTRAEIDRALVGQAEIFGFMHIARTPTLSSKQETFAALENAVLSHLANANAFREQSAQAR